MSVKVKKCVEALRTYLGKDKKGIELLDTLKDAANELRKSLASAEERAEQLEVVKDAARSRADELEKENAAMTAAIHSLRQQLDGHNKREEEIRNLSGVCYRLPSVTPTRLAARLLELQMRLPVCPKPVMTLPIGAGNVPVFDRASLAKDWSTESMCDLGTAVAFLSATYKYIVLVSDRVTYSKQESLDDVPVPTLAYNMLLWLGKDKRGAAKVRDESLEQLVTAATNAKDLPENNVPLILPECRKPSAEYSENDDERERTDKLRDTAEPKYLRKADSDEREGEEAV